MKRNKHTLSHYSMQTFDMGFLRPIGLVEVLPGDTVQHHTTALIRLAPLNTPVMHPTQVRIHHFFVPNRLVWPEWEDFITGGEHMSTPPAYPTVSTNANQNSVSHALGVPDVAGQEINAMPIRAYNMIFNEYFRDQDLGTKASEDSLGVQYVSWGKDYFTTARPWTQKGADINVPLAGEAPVKGIGKGNQVFSATSQAVYESDGSNPTYTNPQVIDNPTAANQFFVEGTGVTGDPNIRADLSQASAASINDFRKAFALQRYQEARARYGSRYTEYLRYLGIRPSDARLQRPEYLGGGTSPINFSEVLQTSAGTAPSVGDLYGHGIAGVRGNRYRKFFEEHGFIMSLCSVRPRTLYLNGRHRMWDRRTKEEYFQRELQHIGQQEIYDREVFVDPGSDAGVWGYQDRYREYREHPSSVLGHFRDSLSTWHMGRKFGNQPGLNEDFLWCAPSKDIYQVAIGDSLWAMFNHHIVARRMVSRNASARIL